MNRAFAASCGCAHREARRTLTPAVRCTIVPGVSASQSDQGGGRDGAGTDAARRTETEDFTMKTLVRVLCAMAFAAVAACQQQTSNSPTTFGPGPQTGGSASGGLAESCLAHGASDCASGLCARTNGNTAVCTHLCDPNTPCETGWKCTSMGLGTPSHWCLRNQRNDPR